jgi:hypothetical protein
VFSLLKKFRIMEQQVVEKTYLPKKSGIMEQQGPMVTAATGEALMEGGWCEDIQPESFLSKAYGKPR